MQKKQDKFDKEIKLRQKAESERAAEMEKLYREKERI